MAELKAGKVASIFINETRLKDYLAKGITTSEELAEYPFKHQCQTQAQPQTEVVCLFGYWRRTRDQEYNQTCHPQERDPSLGKSTGIKDLLKCCGQCDMKQKALIRYRATVIRSIKDAAEAAKPEPKDADTPPEYSPTPTPKAQIQAQQDPPRKMKYCPTCGTNRPYYWSYFDKKDHCDICRGTLDLAEAKEAPKQQ